jgi:hypothetical protein
VTRSQPNGVLITLDQVQAIQGISGPRSVVTAPDWRRFRRVRAGTNIGVAFGPTSARSTATRGLCGPVAEVITCPSKPPVKTCREDVENTAAGVSEGLRRAPLISVVNVPWQAPGFRDQRFPQTGRVVLSTFGASNTRTVQLQVALASYLGTTNAPIATAAPVANTPVSVFSFQVTDAYRGDEVVVSCQDHQVLYLSKWSVSVNGKVASSPFFLIGGRAPLNVQARRGDTISINIIVATGDSFVVPVEVLVNGWIYPTVNQTDGVYSKVLRNSPSWQREEGVPQ